MERDETGTVRVWNARADPRLKVAQRALENFSRRVSRKLFKEHDLARHFVACEMLLDVVLEVVLADGSGSFGNHERLEALSEFLVVDTDHRCFAHDRMIGKQVFDLARKNVLAAGDNHVVVATIDEQKTVFVEVPDIA